MSINKIFKVDVLLIPSVIGTMVTGIGLHVAGDNGNHGEWHNWAVAHVIFSLCFIVIAIMHVVQHKVWYKNLFRPSKKPRIVTALLTAVMVVELLTGIALLIFINGNGSDCGRIHWIAGLVLAVLAAGHIIKRLNILLKGLGIR